MNDSFLIAFSFVKKVVTFAEQTDVRMIKDLFHFYLDNQNDLVKKYNGKYLVITKDGVVGAFDSEPQGYYDAVKKYGLGNFLLQLCTPGDGAYTQHYFSPAVSF